jgi:hypothetical protein
LKIGNSLNIKSKIQHDPSGSVITGVFHPARPTIHAAIDEPLGHLGRKQQAERVKKSETSWLKV